MAASPRIRAITNAAQALRMRSKPVTFATINSEVADLTVAEWNELVALVPQWIAREPETEMPKAVAMPSEAAEAKGGDGVSTDAPSPLSFESNEIAEDDLAEDPIIVAQDAVTMATTAYVEAQSVAYAASAAIKPARERLAKALQKYVAQTVNPLSNSREYIKSQQDNRRAIANGTADPPPAARPGPSHYDRMRAGRSGHSVDVGYGSPRYAPDGKGGLQPIGQRGGRVKPPSDR